MSSCCRCGFRLLWGRIFSFVDLFRIVWLPVSISTALLIVMATPFPSTLVSPSSISLLIAFILSRWFRRNNFSWFCFLFFVASTANCGLIFLPSFDCRRFRLFNFFFNLPAKTKLMTVRVRCNNIWRHMTSHNISATYMNAI